MNNNLLHEDLDRKIYMNQSKGFKNVIGITNEYMPSPKKPHLGAAQ